MERIKAVIFDLDGTLGNTIPLCVEAFRKSIDKNSITWPQILSDETNKITNKYGINSYPTTLLINPEGIIVAKNLRGKELEDKIKELIAR